MVNSNVPAFKKTKNYSLIIDALAESLLVLSDREYQLRVWYRAEGPEVDWYDNAADIFDDCVQLLKSYLRMGDLVFSKDLIKAILRLHAMILHFERIVPWLQQPNDWCEQQLFVIEQPYWDKICKQAEHALSLLKKNLNNQ